MKKLIKEWTFWSVAILAAIYFVLLITVKEYKTAVWVCIAAYWACNSLYLEIKRSYLEYDNLKLARQLFLTTDMLKKYKKEKQEEK
jgi:hypothetical protein